MGRAPAGVAKDVRDVPADLVRLHVGIRRRRRALFPRTHRRQSRGGLNMTTAFIDTIIHGDCLAVLPRVATGSVDFILTDPPYIAPYKPSKNNSGQSVRNNDNAAWLEDS